MSNFECAYEVGEFVGQEGQLLTGFDRFLGAGGGSLDDRCDFIHVFCDGLGGVGLLGCSCGDLSDHLLDRLRTVDDAGKGLAGGVGRLDAALDVEHACAHGFNGFTGAELNGANCLVDFFCGGAGAFGQAAHFTGDDSESAAVFAGACGLNGGVESEEVGLAGNLVDDADDLADGMAGQAEFLNFG